MTETFPGSVCIDCTMMIGSGESSGIGNLREWELRVEALNPTDNGAYRVELVGDSTHFSRSRCDYCGATLGGDRHDVVFIDTRHSNNK